ncbi:uncharacterized protein LOC125660691 [Ostrea edulis]|uniref:uncharacterized protein LOC125660691 n=1 Tax=Ostrea edulis TaxID=37623 RepID=UPI0024AF086D|nr:uncharacterized protein LOC125660691 [Ostrea edulis]
MAVTLAKATAKLGVAGGAVYLTVKEGLWGTSKESNDAYKRLKSKTLNEWLPASVEKPTTTRKIAPVTVKKEATADIRPQQPSQYNACVNKVFETLADLPDTVPKKLNSVVVYFKELSG